MRIRRWLLPVGAALVAGAVLGVAGPAVAGNPDTDEEVSPVSQVSWERLPKELWREVAGHLPPDVQALISMREVSLVHQTQVDDYLQKQPRVWRLLPTATLERLLAAPAVPQTWKDVITATVLVPDVLPIRGPEAEGVADLSDGRAARVVENQLELEVALADPALRLINVVGNGTFDASNVTRDHMLRLHDRVQMENLEAGRIIAYDGSQVRNLNGPNEDFETTYGPTRAVLGVAAFDQVQVHGFAGGVVTVFGEAKVFEPTGGRILLLSPDTGVINPGPGAEIIQWV